MKQQRLSDIEFDRLCGRRIFCLREAYEMAQHTGIEITWLAFKRAFLRSVERGRIGRIGRDRYLVLGNGVSAYSWEYSEAAKDAAERLGKIGAQIKYALFELRQLNDFVNHLIAHNTIFVAVEPDSLDFVFDALHAQLQGRVLSNPNVDDYFKYVVDDCIVLLPRTSEAPVASGPLCAAPPEKWLVDLFAEKVIAACFGTSELPAILEGMFTHYAIDEQKLFRYAKRRGVADHIRAYLREHTQVKLRLEDPS